MRTGMAGKLYDALRGVSIAGAGVGTMGGGVNICTKK